MKARADRAGSEAKSVEAKSPEAKSLSGFSLIEIAIIVAVIGIMAAIATPSFNRAASNQRLKSAAAAMNGILVRARGEAIRTGNIHLVFFLTDALGAPLQNLAGDTVPVLVLDDGPPGSAGQNCRIDAGEPLATIPFEAGVAAGVSGGAGLAPNDLGGGILATGSTFTDPGGNPATWVLFRPEGVSLSFDGGCATGVNGSGAGGFYLTNGTQSQAIVVKPLGGSRVHGWNEAGGQWTN